MSDNNPNNIKGANTTLVGYTASEARKPMYDKDGTSGVLELAIPIDEGYMKDGEFVKQGTTWYTYSAHGQYAEPLKNIAKGSKVRVENAKQEVRAYVNKEGVSQLAINLRFGTINVLDTGVTASGDEPF